MCNIIAVVDWLAGTERAGSTSELMENDNIMEEDFLLTEIKAEVIDEVRDLHSVHTFN